MNTVAPGLIDGGMSAPIFADPAFRRRRTQKVPSGRLGTVEDIAKAVLYLCSDDAEYITGHQLVVDGGVINSIIANLPSPRVGRWCRRQRRRLTRESFPFRSTRGRCCGLADAGIGSLRRAPVHGSSISSDARRAHSQGLPHVP